MNEAIGMMNLVTMNGGWERLVCRFKRQEFWKCISCIILAVTYGKKGTNIWIEIQKSFGNVEKPKLRRDVLGNTNLYKVCCDIYCNFYIYACH